MLRVLGSARKLCGGMTRRDLLRVGGAGAGRHDLAGAGRLASGCGRRRHSSAEIVWPRQVDHPDPSLRLAQPDRVCRSQAQRAGGDSRRAGLDPFQPAGLRRLRAVAELCQGDGPHHGAAVDDASLSVARRGLCADRRADARRAGGVEPARSAQLAVLWLGGRLCRSPARARRPGAHRQRARQHGPAVPLQQPPRRRSAAGRPVRHVPGRRVRSGLDRLCRRGHQGPGQDAGRQAL